MRAGNFIKSGICKGSDKILRPEEKLRYMCVAGISGPRGIVYAVFNIFPCTGQEPVFCNWKKCHFLNPLTRWFRGPPLEAPLTHFWSLRASRGGPLNQRGSGSENWHFADWNWIFRFHFFVFCCSCFLLLSGNLGPPLHYARNYVFYNTKHFSPVKHDRSVNF